MSPAAPLLTTLTRLEVAPLMAIHYSTKMLAALLLGLTLSACGRSSPLAPSAPPPPPPAAPVYVVIGDSLGLGAYFPMVDAAEPAPHRWITAAVGSTSARVQWQPGGSAFAAMQAAIGSQHPTAFLVHLGANDTVLQPPPTADTVFLDLQRLANAIRDAYPGSVLYLADVGQVWTYGDKRRENAEVRAAIERAWRELPPVKPGPLLRDLTPDDGVHFTSPANVQTIAERWLAVLR